MPHNEAFLCGTYAVEFINNGEVHLDIADLIGRGTAAQNPECSFIPLKRGLPRFHPFDATQTKTENQDLLKLKWQW